MAHFPRTLGLLVAMALLVVKVTASPAATDPSSNPEVFQKRVMAAVGKPSSNWASVRFDNISKNDFRLTVLYKKSPSSMAEVEKDTKAVARAVLKVLMDDGRKPREEWVFVFVHAHQPEKGETGGDLVRVYGKTAYDFNTDSLKFTPAK